MKRGHLLLYLWCYTCNRRRPFSKIARWKSPQKLVVKKVNNSYKKLPSQNPVPNVDDDIQLISGTCMVCDNKGSYVIAQEAWEEGYLAPEEFCGCGLPIDHKGLHLEAIRERYQRRSDRQREYL